MRKMKNNHGWSRSLKNKPKWILKAWKPKGVCGGERTYSLHYYENKKNQVYANWMLVVGCVAEFYGFGVLESDLLL